MRMTKAEFHEEVLDLVAALNEAAVAAGEEPIITILQSPALPPDPAHFPAMIAIRDAMAAYRAAHPDAVQGTRKQPTYNWDFAAFFVSLLRPGQPGDGLSYAELAVAADIPPETIYRWLRREPHRIRTAPGPALPSRRRKFKKGS
jgi:hypothetical protein